MDIITERTKRTKWFLEDRFGMFIHWGLYAIPARGEWVMLNEQIPKETYRTYFEEFDPIHYDPKAWARVAKQAGMKYAVMTAKHHDGFCLFDSQLTDYKATNTKQGRDLIREYVEAFRAEGLKVGLYYSLIDWYHYDFPTQGQPFSGDFDRYLDFMHGQVRELCTNYGQIDILWFDYSYGDYVGEKWRATELIKMVRSLQPQVIIDNRLEASGEGAGSIRTKNPNFYAGDFASPEQIIPPRGIVDEDGNSIPWEACITLNNHWGYHSTDQQYKSSKMVIRKLIECVSKSGNMLLNVGPDATGRIPEQSLKILGEIGHWMKQNGESIYGCGQAELSKPEWGYYTQRGNKLYAHIFEPSIGPIAFEELQGQVGKVRLLKDRSEIELVTPWNTYDFPEHIFINFGKPAQLTFDLPDERATVVEFTLKG